MKKVFNLTEIKKYIEKLSSHYNLSFLEAKDIINKTCYKKIKDLKYITFANVLFTWMKEKKPESIIPMVEKFFPTKIGEIKERGHRLEVTMFWYDAGDDKIHCNILDEGCERSLKLHTDLYEERTKEYVEEEIKDIKKHLDKFQGYFICECPDGSKYITDRNTNPSDEGGEYIEIVSYNRRGELVRVNKDTFGRPEMSELYIKD